MFRSKGDCLGEWFVLSSFRAVAVTILGGAMSEWYLRIKGVNFSTTVYDTQDLGATQGASLALLEAPRRVAKELGLETVWQGASQGVFRVAADRAEAVAQSVRHFLRTESPFRQLCFVVDVAEDEERAAALNRFRQMRELSVPLPASVGRGCCPVDRVRPGTEAETKDDNDVSVSASVRERRDYRRARRQSFYQDEIGLEIPDEDWERFAHSFHDIVAKYPADTPEAKHNPPSNVPEALHNKMAVLYFDGNHFGKIRDNLGAKAFGDLLKPLRRDLMQRILEVVPGGVRRIETILWGGDEMMWVVPSRQVWPVLSTIFQQIGSWPHGMTHAGGVVVCHHKTPIRQVVALAKGLADRAKSVTREANAIQMEILESLDIPEGYLGHQREALFGTGLKEAAFTLRGEDWEGLTARLNRIRAEDGLPRSQLYRLLRKARDNKGALTRPVAADLADLLEKGRYALEAGDVCADPIDLARIATVWDYVS